MSDVNQTSQDSVSTSESDARARALITQLLARFDSSTSPSAPGLSAAAVLAPWLELLAPDVELQVGNDAPRVGHAVAAQFFAALLPVMSRAIHELLTISPVTGVDHAFTVRGKLHLTRRRDGHAITTINFVDTLFLDRDRRLIKTYEIRIDPTPLGELFA